MSDAPTVQPTKRPNPYAWSSIGLAVVGSFVLGAGQTDLELSPTTVISALLGVMGLVAGILGLVKAKIFGRGRILGIVGIVVSCLLINVPISNMLVRPGVIRKADEFSAVNSIRLISQAETKYRSTYPSTGYACSLSNLGGSAVEARPWQQQVAGARAQLLPTDLATGQKAGYTFEIINCTTGTQNIDDPYTSYEITAVPLEVGRTGKRGFCADVHGVITFDPSGGNNCIQPLE